MNEVFKWLEENKPVERYCYICELTYTKDTARNNKCVSCGRELEIKNDKSTRNS